MPASLKNFLRNCLFVDQFLSKNTAAGPPKKSISCETEAPQNNFRPLRIRAFNEAHPTVRGKLLEHFHLFLRITPKKENMTFSCTNGCTSTRDFCKYLRSFGFVITLSVSRKIDFLRVNAGYLIQLYSFDCLSCHHR